VSKSGIDSFKLLRKAPIPQFLTGLPIGRFDDVAGADVLYWDSLHFRIASSARPKLDGADRACAKRSMPH
jgi:hypothetical protein